MPIGEPSPVQGSGPGMARKKPLSPVTMSVNAIWFSQSCGVINICGSAKLSFRPNAAKRPA